MSKAVYKTIQFWYVVCAQKQNMQNEKQLAVILIWKKSMSHQ